MIAKKPWAKYTAQEKELMRTAVVHAPPTSPFPPEYAAAYLGKSSSTLQHMRSHSSDGIVYSKIGGHVVYRKKDLDDYIEKNTYGRLA
jgi:hypothetical protein